MSDFKALIARAARLALAAWLAGTLLACSAPGSLAPEDMVGASVTAIGHLGRGIGIPNYNINKQSGGNNFGWGGGGSTSCCVLLSLKVTKPIYVTVTWSTYRSDVDEERFHEAVVPVHFEVDPGKGGAGLYVHFLPGHKVEVWYPRVGPGNPQYPGPAFPRGPAPPYAPRPDEKPALPRSAK